MMQKGLAAMIVLLVVAAWQYRNNRPVFFVVVGTLFAAIPLVLGSHVPERILQSCAFAWLACMLVALAFGVAEIVHWLKNKRKAIVAHGAKSPKS
jgi:hypothetical protein